MIFLRYTFSCLHDSVERHCGVCVFSANINTSNGYRVFGVAVLCDRRLLSIIFEGLLLSGSNLRGTIKWRSDPDR